MRAYAYVVPTFWTRGSGKKLRGKPLAQALALYVMTAPSSNMIGLYYVPLTTIAAETGIPAEALPAVFQDIREIAKYDFENEVVWVPEAAAHQVGETMKALDKRRAQVMRDAEAMGSHPFALEFFSKYGAPYGIEVPNHADWSEGLATNQEGPSEGHPPDEKPRSPDPVLPLSLGDGSDRDHEPEISTAASSEDLTRSAGADEASSGVHERAESLPPVAVFRDATNLAEALAMPIAKRASRVLANPYVGEFQQPSKWPEVQRVAAAWAKAFGISNIKLRDTVTSDRDLLAVLEALAHGDSVDDLELAGRLAETDQFFTDMRAKRKGGPATFTAAVLRRLLASRAPATGPGLAGTSTHPDRWVNPDPRALSDYGPPPDDVPASLDATGDS